MTCRLFGAKPLPEPMLNYCQLDHEEQTSVKFESKLFIHENAVGNVVYEMVTILFMGWWVWHFPNAIRNIDAYDDVFGAVFINTAHSPYVLVEHNTVLNTIR